MNRRLLWAVGAVVLIALTWLGMNDNEPEAQPEPGQSSALAGQDTSPDSTPARSDESTPPSTIEPEHIHDHDHPEESGEDALAALDEPVEARWDAAAQHDVEQAAATAMNAYTDHQATPAQWWRHLEPLLTPGAQFVYVDVPHEQIPATTLTGDITATGTMSPLLATALVGTDAGTYELTFTRVNGAADWLVDRIVPLEQP